MKKLLYSLLILMVVLVSAFALIACNTCEHQYIKQRTDAGNCVTYGSTTYKCSLCQDVKTEQSTTYGNHDYTETDVNATCKAGGYTLHECKYCPDSYKTNETPKLTDHDYEVVDSKDATCEADGYTKYECPDCGRSYTDTEEELDHDYDVVDSKSATCKADGYTKYECDNCGDTYTETEDKLEHNYTSSSSGASCTSGGTITYTCNNCGDSYTEESTGSGNHSATKYTCSGCNKKFSSLLISFIMENGTYDNGSYVTSNTYTTSDSTAYINLLYSSSNNAFGLVYKLVTKSGTSQLTMTFNNADSGTYAWQLEFAGYKMLGQLSASSIFSSSTTVSYLTFNGSSSLATSFNKLATSSIKAAVSMCDLVFAKYNAGFTMYNLGFTYISTAPKQ